MGSLIPSLSLLLLQGFALDCIFPAIAARAPGTAKQVFSLEISKPKHSASWIQTNDEFPTNKPIERTERWPDSHKLFVREEGESELWPSKQELSTIPEPPDSVDVISSAVSELLEFASINSQNAVLPPFPIPETNEPGTSALKGVPTSKEGGRSVETNLNASDRFSVYDNVPSSFIPAEQPNASSISAPNKPGSNAAASSRINLGFDPATWGVSSSQALEHPEKDAIQAPARGKAGGTSRPGDFEENAKHSDRYLHGTPKERLEPQELGSVAKVSSGPMFSRANVLTSGGSASPHGSPSLHVRGTIGQDAPRSNHPATRGREAPTETFFSQQFQSGALTTAANAGNDVLQKDTGAPKNDIYARVRRDSTTGKKVTYHVSASQEQRQPNAKSGAAAAAGAEFQKSSVPSLVGTEMPNEKDAIRLPALPQDRGEENASIGSEKQRGRQRSQSPRLREMEAFRPSALSRQDEEPFAEESFASTYLEAAAAAAVMHRLRKPAAQARARTAAAVSGRQSQKGNAPVGSAIPPRIVGFTLKKNPLTPEEAEVIPFSSQLVKLVNDRFQNAGASSAPVSSIARMPNTHMLGRPSVKSSQQMSMSSEVDNAVHDFLIASEALKKFSKKENPQNEDKTLTSIARSIGVTEREGQKGRRKEKVGYFVFAGDPK